MPSEQPIFKLGWGRSIARALRSKPGTLTGTVHFHRRRAKISCQLISHMIEDRAELEWKKAGA